MVIDSSSAWNTPRVRVGRQWFSRKKPFRGHDQNLFPETEEAFVDLKAIRFREMFGRRNGVRLG
jgi:hypothetical protein